MFPVLPRGAAPAALKLLLMLLLVLISTPGHGVIETYQFSAVELEQRYHRLSQELRCPKCQNQNIADSNAPISEDLRRLLYEQLEAGASDREILDAMVARYGEFVRYRPETRGVTLWLWLAPALLLVAGVLLLITVLRNGRDPLREEISDDERARLAQLLDEDGKQP